MTSNVIARKVAEDMARASWTREMFEKGLRLKAQYGADNVQDFSLGNPNGKPPEAFFEALAKVAGERRPELHRYMPNVGFDFARAAVARFLSAEYRIPLEGADVILTSGAAGGMSITLRTICDPGSEVMLLAPYFSEYLFYVEQVNGVPVGVPTDEHFQPDPAAIEAAITDRTRAIIVNSPNNPSGAVYTEETCRKLAEVLAHYDRPDRPIYLLVDDPYRRILYDIPWCPTPVHHYSRSIIVSSYSKDLSIPGERLGYVALPHDLPGREAVFNAMAMLNRTLGYVNASAFMQRVITHCAGALCDVEFYRNNRDLLCDALEEFGYDFLRPGGAFYVFPRSPTPDDGAFVDRLLEYKILAVPGKGFGRPGFIRLSFCVETQTIERALHGFRAAIKDALP